MRKFLFVGMRIEERISLRHFSGSIEWRRVPQVRCLNLGHLPCCFSCGWAKASLIGEQWKVPCSIGRLIARFPQTFPSFCSTSVLPFWWNVLPSLQVRFHYRFAGRWRFTLFPDGVEQLSGKMIPHGDPARFDDEKTPNRKFPKAADFQHGAPRQSPLQDYSADAHPSFRPQQRPF